MLVLYCMPGVPGQTIIEHQEYLSAFIAFGLVETKGQKVVQKRARINISKLHVNRHLSVTS